MFALFLIGWAWEAASVYLVWVCIFKDYADFFKYLPAHTKYFVFATQEK